MGFLSSTKTVLKRHRDQPTPSSRRDNNTDKFFPAKIGQQFCERYVVEDRLGSGRYASVWLVKDVKTNESRALKILNSDFYNGRYRLFELEVMQKVSKVSAHSSHPGRHHVTRLLDHFDISGPTGRHVCLVMPVLGASIAEQTTTDKILYLPPEVVKCIARQMLQALDFLHTECGVIHTDIQPSNILQDPRNEPTDKQGLQFRLNDLGVACFVDRHLTDRIQSAYLRSPEISLEAPWDESVDTYSLGCLLYQFITGDLPFPGKASADRNAEQDRLETLVSHFGPVPNIVLEGAAKTKVMEERGVNLQDVNDQSNFATLEDIVAERTAGRDAKETMSPEEIRLFCDLLRRMLVNDPRNREKARTLALHPWLSTH